MTITAFVTSKTMPMPPVPVQGTGDNTVTATRAAIQFARTVKGIEKPVLLETREGVEALRRWANEHASELVRVGTPNGHSSLMMTRSTPADRYKN